MRLQTSREERITTLFVQVQLEQVGSRRELLDAYSVFWRVCCLCGRLVCG